MLYNSLKSTDPRILMTDSCFPAQIAEITNPENGTIYWTEAAYAAKIHGLWDDFKTDYGTTDSFGGVDAGEFLSWLGY